MTDNLEKRHTFQLFTCAVTCYIKRDIMIRRKEYDYPPASNRRYIGN
jgi:hypothetical protein